MLAIRRRSICPLAAIECPAGCWMTAVPHAYVGAAEEKMAPFLKFMATAHVNSFGKGFSALARARQTGDWHERNTQVSKVGECSAIIGLINLAFLLGVIFQLAGIHSLPFPPIILWFIFLTGLVGFIIGFFLQTINNPGDHINLATATLFAATVGAVFAMGVFAATSFPV